MRLRKRLLDLQDTQADIHAKYLAERKQNMNAMQSMRYVMQCAGGESENDGDK